MVVISHRPYQRLDDAIVDALRKEPMTFRAMLFTHRIATEMDQVAADRAAPIAWRVLDSRLQALKRRGAIHYHQRDGWKAVTPESTAQETP